MRFNGGGSLEPQVAEDICILNLVSDDQCKEIITAVLNFMTNPKVSDTSIV